MQTGSVRQGQIEIGIIEHNGREFSAIGASVIRRRVTDYTRLVDGDIHLATWCGETMLACRSEVVERFWSGTMAVMFRLARGRFIVGNSLGMGMLFRCELIVGSDADAVQWPASWPISSPNSMPRMKKLSPRKRGCSTFNFAAPNTAMSGKSSGRVPAIPNARIATRRTSRP